MQIPLIPWQELSWWTGSISRALGLISSTLSSRRRLPSTWTPTTRLRWTWCTRRPSSRTQCWRNWVPMLWGFLTRFLLCSLFTVQSGVHFLIHQNLYPNLIYLCAGRQTSNADHRSKGNRRTCKDWSWSQEHQPRLHFWNHDFRHEGWGFPSEIQIGINVGLGGAFEKSIRHFLIVPST